MAKRRPDRRPGLKALTVEASAGVMLSSSRPSNRQFDPEAWQMPR